MLTTNDSASFPTEESQNKLNSALIPQTTVYNHVGIKQRAANSNINYKSIIN